MDAPAEDPLEREPDGLPDQQDQTDDDGRGGRRGGAIPRGSLSRGFRLAQLPAAFAGRQAVGLGRRLGGRSQADVQASVQQATAEQVFKVLGQLKGGAMKVGQALSVLEAALPEEQAGPYRAALTKLQDAAPPMPAATVRAVMSAELGPGWRSMFTAFDEKPAAAASVGQVHRATWSDGRQVAVKVQYPGAGDALLGDLDQVGRLVRVAAGWIPGMEVGPIIAELRERVAEELDYRAEGANQQAFADAFADDDEVVVPAVVLATGRVLVSEWMDGVPLSKVIAEGTQEQRDLAARRYLEVLLLGPARAGLLHADPHPGNFRLTPDGRFGILDFGAVNRLPNGMPPAIGRLLGAALDGDSETVADGLREEGFIRERIQVDPDQLLDYLSPFVEPLRHEEFRFDRAWLQSLFKHVNDRERPEWTINLKVNLPPEYVLIHRVWFGGIGVMCQLGGVVPAVQVLSDFLPEFAEEELEDSEVS